MTTAKKVSCIILLHYAVVVEISLIPVRTHRPVILRAPAGSRPDTGAAATDGNAEGGHGRVEQQLRSPAANGRGALVGAAACVSLVVSLGRVHGACDRHR